MANIADKAAQIRQAILGKDVRESLASGIEAINTEVESTTNRQTILETNMAAAENMRQNAEAARITNEDIRISNEDSRSAEHAQQVADVEQIKSAYDAATKANLSVEVSNARGTFENLETRLNDADSLFAVHKADYTAHKAENTQQITDLQTNKADKTAVNDLSLNKASVAYVDGKTAALASGSPKGAFATLAALQAAYPSGSTGIYIVTADGYWYYWSGSAWTAGGPYQSAAIADKSIKDKHIDKIQLNKLRNNLVALSTFTKWNDPGNLDVLTATDDQLVFTKNRTDASSGALSATVDLTGLPYDKVTVKITAVLTGAWSFYLFTTSGNYVTSVQALVNGSSTIEMTKAYLQGLGLSTGFIICVAAGASNPTTLTITSMNVNVNGYEATLEKILADIYAKFNGEVSKIAAGSVMLDDMNREVLNSWNIAYSDLEIFPSRFDSGYMTETVQSDGSHILTKTTDNKGPGPMSANLNANGHCTKKREFWYYIKAKTSHPGSSLTIYIYRDDTYNAASSNVVINLTDQYVEYKGKVSILEDVPANVGCYMIVKIGTATGCNLQYEFAYLTESVEPFTYSVYNVAEWLLNAIGGYSLETNLGQMVNFNNAAYTENSVSGYHLVTPDISSNGDNVIKKVGVYVSTAGTYTFVIGTIDQNSLVIQKSSFTLTCTTGYNEFDLEDQQYSIPYNYRLFMDIASYNKLYTPNPTSLKTVPVMVQDDAHVITGNYTGMIMYSSDYMIPFGYTVRGKKLSQKVKDMDDKVTDLGNQISGNTITETIVTQPNGNKMVLRVDASGNVVAGNYYPKKAVFIGNSLLQTNGSIGMCASDQYHDYFYLVKTYLQSFRNDVQCTKVVGNAWEASTTSQARLDWWNNTAKASFADDTDLVIIQLVDNVNTAEKQATFGEDAITLVELIRTQCPRARILWVAGWYVDTDRINKVKAACSAREAEFVDITPYNSDSQYKGYIGMVRTGTSGSQWTVTDSGEASHPGDLGHAKIAETIETVLGLSKN